MVKSDFKEFHVDGARLRPVSQLGKKYVLVTPTGSNPQRRVFSQIAAVKNKTNVTVTVPHTVSSQQDFALLTSKSMNLTSNGSDEVGTVELGHLEVFSLGSEDGSLTGIVVETDEPVAVSSGTEDVKMSSDANNDLLWTGLDPVELWGTDYVTFPTPGDTSHPEVSCWWLDIYALPLHLSTV